MCSLYHIFNTIHKVTKSKFTLLDTKVTNVCILYCSLYRIVSNSKGSIFQDYTVT